MSLRTWGKKKQKNCLCSWNQEGDSTDTWNQDLCISKMLVSNLPGQTPVYLGKVSHPTCSQLGSVEASSRPGLSLGPSSPPALTLLPCLGIAGGCFVAQVWVHVNLGQIAEC